MKKKGEENRQLGQTANVMKLGAETKKVEIKGPTRKEDGERGHT